MTIQEYMDPERFPATTQKALSLKGQLRMDAFNYNQLREFLENGGKLNGCQQQCWEELQEKMKHQGGWTGEAPRRRLRKRKGEP